MVGKDVGDLGPCGEGNCHEKTCGMLSSKQVVGCCYAHMPPRFQHFCGNRFQNQVYVWHRAKTWDSHRNSKNAGFLPLSFGDLFDPTIWKVKHSYLIPRCGVSFSPQLSPAFPIDNWRFGGIFTMKMVLLVVYIIDMDMFDKIHAWV